MAIELLIHGFRLFASKFTQPYQIRKVFTIIKKHFVKGILAAALALSTVFSINQNTRFTAPLLAAAACNHNYRHYQSSTPCVKVPGTEVPCGNELTYYDEVCTSYNCCVNCGGDKSNPKPHRRRVCEWDTMSPNGTIIAHHKAVVKNYY
jgi:type II secretory pathway pseudopilin PulG